MFSSELPLYYQLMEEIKKMIDEECECHDSIPSEHKLMDYYRVSRTTVRKAIEELVNQGYLYKVHGKGTFVSGNSIGQGLVNLTSCTEDVKNMGLSQHYDLLAEEVILSNKRISDYLHIRHNQPVFHLERVSYGDDTPINLTHSYIPYDFVPDIDQYDFGKNSLYQILKEQYHIKLTESVRSFEAILCNQPLSEQLHVCEGTPLIKFIGQVKGILPTGEEKQIEYFVTYYRTDTVKFFVKQVNQ